MGLTLDYPIIAGGKNKCPDLDNLEYAIANILEGVCYPDDVQVVTRPFPPTKNYADYCLMRWPQFADNQPDAYSLLICQSNLAVSHYLKQCRQPFTGVFIRVEEVK